jgi:hypothetical protein
VAGWGRSAESVRLAQEDALAPVLAPVLRRSGAIWVVPCVAQRVEQVAGREELDAGVGVVLVLGPDR